LGGLCGFSLFCFVNRGVFVVVAIARHWGGSGRRSGGLFQSNASGLRDRQPWTTRHGGRNVARTRPNRVPSPTPYHPHGTTIPMRCGGEVSPPNDNDNDPPTTTTTNAKRTPRGDEHIPAESRTDRKLHPTEAVARGRPPGHGPHATGRVGGAEGLHQRPNGVGRGGGPPRLTSPPPL